MLLEQCRPLNGRRAVWVVCGGFCHLRHKNGPCAVRRLLERWNDVSGGCSRTGPAFCDPGRRSLHSQARDQNSSAAAPHLLVSSISVLWESLRYTSKP